VNDLIPLLAQEFARIGALIRHGQTEEIVRTSSTGEDE